jgi:hypothetical protein
MRRSGTFLGKINFKNLVFFEGVVIFYQEHYAPTNNLEFSYKINKL